MAEEIIKANVLDNFAVQWADSETYMEINGKVIKVGTSLLINNSIFHLSFLESSQLLELKSQVNEAIDYELSKRSE
jgi:hypothetical protein